MDEDSQPGVIVTAAAPPEAPNDPISWVSTAYPSDDLYPVGRYKLRIWVFGNSNDPSVWFDVEEMQ